MQLQITAKDDFWPIRRADALPDLPGPDFGGPVPGVCGEAGAEVRGRMRGIWMIARPRTRALDSRRSMPPNALRKLPFPASVVNTSAR